MKLLDPIEDQFKKRWDCEIKEHSDLSAIKQIKKNGDLQKLNECIGIIRNNKHTVSEESFKSGAWMYRVFWNDDVERVQVACYKYSAGITFEPDSEDFKESNGDKE